MLSRTQPRPSFRIKIGESDTAESCVLHACAAAAAIYTCTEQFQESRIGESGRCSSVPTAFARTMETPIHGDFVAVPGACYS